MSHKNFFSLPDLPYDFSALEPVISKQTLELHYGKHHKAYVDKYNEVLEKFLEAQEQKDGDLLVSLLPILEFNGGGHLNHSFFWNSLCSKNHAASPSKNLFTAFEKDFGSWEQMKKNFFDKALSIFGSGWAWLCVNLETGHMSIETTLLHGTLKGKKQVPLFVADVWEHSYYLQYQNRRGDYLKAIWDIVNWKMVEKRFLEVSLHK